MNTADVVKALANHWDLTQAESRRLLDNIVKILNDNLSSGNAYTIPGLGTFRTSTREERKSYNPHYKQYMKLPPKRTVDFSPSKGLKDNLKQREPDNE